MTPAGCRAPAPRTGPALAAAGHAWLDYEYWVLSDPSDTAFDAVPDGTSTKIVITIRGLWVVMPEGDAMIAVLDDVPGFHPTDTRDLFRFDLWYRPDLDDWARQRHAPIDYRWIEKFHIAVADMETRRRLD